MVAEAQLPRSRFIPERMYHKAVQKLAQRVLAYIRRQELLKPGDRVGVAVSGGADSVALLRLLLELRGELGLVLAVVHFNHKLRGTESDADQAFVAALALDCKLEFHHESADIATHAREQRLSLEAAARELRYGYFRRLLLDGGLNRIATAHTLDDQAETVLLRAVRGAGTRGLAGIYPKLLVGGSMDGAQHSALSIRPGKSRRSPVTGRQGVGSQVGAGSPGREGGTIIRPLLGVRRKDVEAYLLGRSQAWRDDSSNRDLRFARNRVRHGILPRLERNLNPAVRDALSETAEIARAEEEYWQREIERLLPQAWGRKARERGGALKADLLAGQPLALQRRLVRAAAEWLGLRLEFGHVEEVLRVLGGDWAAGKPAPLPHGWTVSLHRHELHFDSPEAREPGSRHDYEYPLPVPGRVRLREISGTLEAVSVRMGEGAGYNPEHLYAPQQLPKELVVRNWRPGDRFWPAHTKSPKKIKELLQERHIPQAERRMWPVVAAGEEILWMRGFPAPARVGPQEGAKAAVLIREVPFAESEGEGRE